MCSVPLVSMQLGPGRLGAQMNLGAALSCGVGCGLSEGGLWWAQEGSLPTCDRNSLALHALSCTVHMRHLLTDCPGASKGC